MFKKGDTVLISKKSRSKYRGKTGKVIAIEHLGKIHVTVDMGGVFRPTTISKQMLSLIVVEKKEERNCFIYSGDGEKLLNNFGKTLQECVDLITEWSNGSHASTEYVVKRHMVEALVTIKKTIKVQKV